MLAEGLGRKEIATRRGCKPSTIRTLAGTAYGRLGVRTAAQCVSVMNASGWLDLVDTEFEDIRLTAGQVLYLRAFERWLRDPHSEDLADERAFWLRGIYYEADLTPPWEVLGQPQPVRRIPRRRG